MLIRFRTAAPQDYTNFRYVIVFNTSGTGGEPLPQAALTGYQNYSFSFVVGGASGAVGLPQLLQYYTQPGSSNGIQTIAISVPPNLLQFVPNSGGNGAGGEFQIQFSRALLYGINPGGSPTPTAAPSAAPVPNPTTVAQQTWYINFITTDPSGTPIDSVGLGGATDTSFSATFDTTQSLSNSYQKPVPSSLSNQAAVITGYQVINSP
jgi:hypothetical protein